MTRTFDAAHHLPGHAGKCARPHGHTYRLEVCVGGPILCKPGKTDDGMVLDFGDLKRAVDGRVVNVLDHQDLNVVLHPIRTTAENVALWAFQRLREELGMAVVGVRLWETPTGCAEVGVEDLP